MANDDPMRQQGFQRGPDGWWHLNLQVADEPQTFDMFLHTTEGDDLVVYRMDGNGRRWEEFSRTPLESLRLRGVHAHDAGEKT